MFRSLKDKNKKDATVFRDLKTYKIEKEKQYCWKFAPIGKPQMWRNERKLWNTASWM